MRKPPDYVIFKKIIAYKKWSESSIKASDLNGRTIGSFYQTIKILNLKHKDIFQNKYETTQYLEVNKINKRCYIYKNLKKISTTFTIIQIVKKKLETC